MPAGAEEQVPKRGHRDRLTLLDHACCGSLGPVAPSAVKGARARRPSVRSSARLPAARAATRRAAACWNSANTGEGPCALPAQTRFDRLSAQMPVRERKQRSSRPARSEWREKPGQASSSAAARIASVRIDFWSASAPGG
jgi:hypothetical protein